MTPNTIEWYESRYPAIAGTMDARVEDAAALCRCGRTTINSYRSLIREREGRAKKRYVHDGEAVWDGEDRLLAALQRRHPPHADASAFALAHEYPPMRRGVRRLEAVS